MPLYTSGGPEVKNLPASAGGTSNENLIPGWGRSPGVGNGKANPVILPGKVHGQWSLAGYSPQGHKELDRSERLSTHRQRMHTSGTEPRRCVGVGSQMGANVPPGGEC